MYEFKKKYERIHGSEIDLRLISYEKGNEAELPYYWYDIILKAEDKSIGKISIRLGENYHSLYNGNIGYEIDEEYRGHNYSLTACKMVCNVAREYGMTSAVLTCDDDNAASYKIIERLGARLQNKQIPPRDYFGYYEGMPVQRIYRLEL